jgi:hypothetical protein
MLGSLKLMRMGIWASSTTASLCSARESVLLAIEATDWGRRPPTDRAVLPPLQLCRGIAASKSIAPISSAWYRPGSLERIAGSIASIWSTSMIVSYPLRLMRYMGDRLKENPGGARWSDRLLQQSLPSALLVAAGIIDQAPDYGSCRNSFEPLANEPAQARVSGIGM